jgi:hypothetical protein
MRNTDSHRPISAGSVPGFIDGLKLTDVANGALGIAFSGQASPNGTLYNSELAKTSISTGRIYTKVFVRHWDTCKVQQQTVPPRIRH